MKMKFFNIAKIIATRSDHHSHHMGCVIVKKNRVVSIGWNELKTHSKSLHEFKYRHAEFNAILNTPLNELQGATAYIYREHRNGQPALAKPCPSCLKSLQLVGIDKICYSIDGGYQKENI